MGGKGGNREYGEIVHEVETVTKPKQYNFRVTMIIMNKKQTDSSDMGGKYGISKDTRVGITVEF